MLVVIARWDASAGRQRSCQQSPSEHCHKNRETYRSGSSMHSVFSFWRWTLESSKRMVRALILANPLEHPSYQVPFNKRLLQSCAPLPTASALDISVPQIRRKIWQSRKNFAENSRTDPGAQVVASTQYPRHFPVLPATRNRAWDNHDNISTEQQINSTGTGTIFLSKPC